MAIDILKTMENSYYNSNQKPDDNKIKKNISDTKDDIWETIGSKNDGKEENPMKGLHDFMKWMV